jgi:GT2 family glycosyltransferase
MIPRVQVSIVTHNSERYLNSCLVSLKAQTYKNFVVSLWDNASADRTPEMIRADHDFPYAVHFSDKNVGFCRAHNRLIANGTADYVLVLNPDVILNFRFIEILVLAMDQESRAGSASGKLWRWQADELGPELSARQASSARTLDTTGIYFTPNQRHLDRGSGEIDTGQYDRREYVFGASGAAAFYRRAMLEDVKDGNEYFDEAFFAYREDADLAWRAQWMGWLCLYVPEASGYHARKVLPERRSTLPEQINMHSFKNRFLLRTKNMDLGTYFRFFIPITLRDICAFAYVLAWEWSSLPGVLLLIQSLPHAWEVRKSLKRHRRVRPQDIRSWFSNKPVAKSLLNVSNSCITSKV